MRERSYRRHRRHPFWFVLTKCRVRVLVRNHVRGLGAYFRRRVLAEIETSQTGGTGPASASSGAR